MKKILIAFLCGCAFVAPTMFAANFKFPDVSEKDWFYEDVRSLQDLDVIRGNDDGSFEPQRDANRAEIAVMFRRYNRYIKRNYYNKDQIKRMFNKFGFDISEFEGEGEGEDEDKDKDRDKKDKHDDSGDDGKNGNNDDDDNGDSDEALPEAVIQEPDFSRRGAFFDTDPSNSLRDGSARLELADGTFASVQEIVFEDTPGAETDASWFPVAVFFNDKKIATAYFLPEVEDEVLVGFESGDTRAPVTPYGVVGESFVLDGSQSNTGGKGNDIHIDTFTWIQIDGPSALEPQVGTTPSFVPDLPGNYVFQLTVTDTTGIQSAPSQIKVIIMP